MDAFLVDGFDLEGGDALVLLESEGDVTKEVLDEDSVAVGLHGGVSFVGTLKQCMDWR